MPTRIVLKETTPAVSRLAVGTAGDNEVLSVEEEFAVLQAAAGVAFRTPPRAGRTSTGQAPTRASSSHRKVVGFRSSILRDFSTKNGSGFDMDEDDNVRDEAAERRRLQLHLSNEDIRASPRLLGYLFAGIASVVMLVSVVQFYLREDLQWDISENTPDKSYNLTRFPIDTYFHTINGPVFRWKLWACIGVASAGSLIFLVIMLMHFDTICFPRVWFQIFRDGSLAERNLLMFLLVFWAVSLHVNTSTFSVGEVQANVFFTTWIVFVCCTLNYGVWRDSADLPRLAIKVLNHHRETTYNWCWTLTFDLITAGAATDMFFYREEITLRLKGEELVLDFTNWMRVLGLVWAQVLLCFVVIALNHYWTSSCTLNLGDCRFVLDWKFLEGLIALALVGLKFYVILTLTGVDGVINGLNNAYFGVWGGFFNIVFTFGTWLRENRDIDYLI